jgi:hypothetical protein
MTRFLALVVFVSLAGACSTPGKASTPTVTVGEERISFSVRLAEVPSGARSITLRISMPAALLEAGLEPEEASILVGNALTNVALGQGPTRVGKGEIELVWEDAAGGTAGARELRVASAGKPIELSVTFAGPAVAAERRDELERALARATSATADGRALSAVATRLE